MNWPEIFEIIATLAFIFSTTFLIIEVLERREKKKRPRVSRLSPEACERIRRAYPENCTAPPPALRRYGITAREAVDAMRALAGAVYFCKYCGAANPWNRKACEECGAEREDS